MRTETLWLNSPWNNAEEVRQQLNFAEKIQLHDVTLRDGEQQAGLVFSHDDKIAIAERLAEVGIHRIEAGMPAVSAADAKAVADIVKRNLGPKIFSFARCMKADIDKVADSGAEALSSKFRPAAASLNARMAGHWKRRLRFPWRRPAMHANGDCIRSFSPSMGAAHSLTILCRSSRLLRRMAIWMRLAA